MKVINWTVIDWSQRTVDIAASLSVSPSVVSYHRLKNHLRKNDRANHRIDWSNVDHCGPCGHYSPAKFPLVVSPENGTEQIQTDKAALDYRYAMADAEVEVKVNTVVLHLPKTREHK